MPFKDYILNSYKLTEKLNAYLEVKGSDLFYNDIKLLDLVSKYETPLSVAYTPSIQRNIKTLKEIFTNAILKYNYKGEFLYTYATKANYYSEVIASAVNVADGLEVTSSYDLDIVQYLNANGIFEKSTLILCNGFKHERYFNKIQELAALGFNLIPIIENEVELDMFLNATSTNLFVGLRLNVNTAFLEKYGLKPEGEIDIKGRFGISEDALQKYVDKISQTSHLKVKLLHVHLGGTNTDSEYFSNVMAAVVENVYAKLPTTVTMLDIGGGLPTAYTLNFSFDFQKFADLLISKLALITMRKGIVPPTIVGEFGRYTVNDHGFLIYKVDLSKPTEKKDTLWYLINGSLMSQLPDMWALGQRFIVLPLNGWDREHQNVILSGLTCDPDDYYSGESSNLVLPQLKEDEPLYIGVFGVGAYQEMLSGIKGVHHCLIPEPTELVIYKENGILMIDKTSNTQSPDTILQLLDFKKEHNLHRYKNT